VYKKLKMLNAVRMKLIERVSRPDDAQLISLASSSPNQVSMVNKKDKEMQ
jgi:hypothetical protein